MSEIDQLERLVKELKRFVVLVVAVVCVLWGLVHCLSIKYLLTSQCRCSAMSLETSGNKTEVNVSNENPIDRQVREILIKKGKIDGQLPRSLSVKSYSGGRD